jgi:hypothetical protein
MRSLLRRDDKTVGTNRIRHRGHISVKKNKSPFDEFQRAFLLTYQSLRLVAAASMV